MAAITKLSPSPAPQARPMLLTILSAIVTGLRRLSRACKNRRQARMLTTMDDRMLADIGLTRSDLRDAYAGPLWRDPTDMLNGRAQDRRRYRSAVFGARRTF